jgi:hypothetical protein
VAGEPCKIYIKKDGNPFTISTRHVKANINTRDENQTKQNSRNEVEDLMVTGNALPQMSYWSFTSCYVCERDEDTGCCM